MKKTVKTALLLAASILGIIIIAGAVIGYIFYSELIQITEIGKEYIYVFLTNFSTEFYVQIISFFIIFLFIFANIFILRNVMRKIDINFEYLKKIFPLVALSAVMALFVSGFIKENISLHFLNFKNSVSFNSVDPIFGKDLSYYVFIRPFLMSIFRSLIGVQIFVIIFNIIAYFFLYSSLGRFTFKDVLKQNGICVHILVNCAILLFMWAIEYKFKAEEILYSTFNELNGAGYTQTHIWLNFYNIMPFILIAIAFVSVVLIYNKKLKFAVGTIALFPLIYIAVFISSFFMQYIIVEPSEVQMEEPYIKRNIEYTRMAYGIDKIKEKEFPADNSISLETLEREKETLENIRIIDYDSSKIIINQIQSLRNYYEFNDLDISVANVNGKKMPVATAVREIKKTSDSATTKNYINDKLRFTHGYGLVSMPINKVSSEGQPIFFAKDIPLMYDYGYSEITQPRIYYSENKDEYSIVNTSMKEFDYLRGEENVETTYEGKAGIKLNFLNRLVFAIKNRDYQILVSQFINSESKILTNKNVLERVKKAVPFLSYDEDPYPIVDSKGKIKWIIDAYTKTDKIPYSQVYKNEEFNYIRNSAKAVVDAYDGTVSVYITDETDPLIMAYKKMYPTAFSYDMMPDDIKNCIKYSETYFKIQVEMLKRYHTTDTTTFYNKSDVWDVAYELKNDQVKKAVEPYYNMLRLNGKKEANVILMIPYTISEKENMVSWLCAGSDSSSYGEMYLYTFPQGKNVYGPLQIEKRINSNKDISKEMTLWGQGGSQVVRGNMLTVPVGKSFIYIEPIYITSEKNSFPELKMIIGSYGDKIVMKPTIDETLNALFENVPKTDKEANALIHSGSVSEMFEDNNKNEETASDNAENIDINSIREAYDKVKEALKNDDWIAFGESMKELEEKIKYENSEVEESEEEKKEKNEE